MIRRSGAAADPISQYRKRPIRQILRDAPLVLDLQILFTGVVFRSKRIAMGFRYFHNGGVKDLPWYARSGTPQSRSVVGTC